MYNASRSPFVFYHSIGGVTWAPQSAASIWAIYSILGSLLLYWEIFYAVFAVISVLPHVLAQPLSTYLMATVLPHCLL